MDGLELESEAKCREAGSCGANASETPAPKEQQRHGQAKDEEGSRGSANRPATEGEQEAVTGKEAIS